MNRVRHGTTEDVFWRLLADCLTCGRSAVLTVVAETSGSSPGRAGMKLLLTDDGRRVGTVGGGEVERRVIELAHRLRSSTSTRSIVETFQLGDRNDGHRTGMACGGSMKVALALCRPDSLPMVRALLDSRERGSRGCLCLSPAGFGFESVRAPGGRNLIHATSDDWSYEEDLVRDPRAYLVGGGHVSLALSEVLAMLDYRVTVFEIRENLNTFAQNVHAFEKRQLPDYHRIGAEVPDGPDVFAFVMTHSHALDRQVLVQLLRKDLAYVGMLGSGTKIAAVLEYLRQFGTLRGMERLHAPAGLPVGSHTPAEIAVSIAAEVIRVRSLSDKPDRILVGCPGSSAR